MNDNTDWDATGFGPRGEPLESSERGTELGGRPERHCCRHVEFHRAPFARPSKDSAMVITLLLGVGLFGPLVDD